MKALLTVVQFVVSGGLVAVALLSLRDWFKQRDDPALRYQTLAIVSLGVVSLISRLRVVFPSIPVQVLSPISLVAFFLSGYGLWLLRNQIIPSGRAVRYALPIVLLATAIFSGLVMVLRGSPAPGAKISGIQLIATLAIVAAWLTCVVDPAIRFWYAARRRNSVQRARLHALSIGYLAIIAIFIFAILSLTKQQDLSVQLALQLMAIVIVPLLWAAFSPPAWLKKLWRASEDAAYQTAIQEMVLYSPTRQILAERALDWAVRFVGADKGMIVDADSQIIGLHEISESDAETIVEQIDTQAEGVVRLDSKQSVVVIPLQLAHSVDRMIIVSGTLTPVFAGDEVQQLRAYCTVVAIALERVAISERVNALEQAKSDFLNLASHELTGPLTVLQGYFSMLVAGDINIGKDNKLTSILLKQIEQMSLIVSQMIESARIDDERLELHREPSDLGGIVSQVVRDRAELLPDTHRIEMVNGLEKLPVIVDVERVSTIVLNLLDNAIKYSPDGGLIRCALQNDDGYAQFKISDEGIGIAPEDREKLFVRFGRVVGQANANIPGTGLGLYLCRELARRHQGDVSLLPTTEKGTTFLLKLPLADAAHPEPNGKNQTSRATSRSGASKA